MQRRTSDHAEGSNANLAIVPPVIGTLDDQRLRAFRGRLPADFKFDRDEANAR
jgi:hypothetical protein